MSAAKVTWTGHLIIGVSNKNKYPAAPGMWKVAGRLTVGKPSLGADEVAVKVSVELPASLFRSPSLEARITVPESAVTPLEIGLDVRDNIENLIQQNTGFKVQLVEVKP